jgi:IMP dehydrogenase
MRLLGKALTFDDVLLVPAYSQVLPKDTSLATKLSRNIQLNLPLVSAAMDTVTEARLAIAIAQEGGIGIHTAKHSIDRMLPHAASLAGRLADFPVRRATAQVLCATVQACYRRLMG